MRTVAFALAAVGSIALAAPQPAFAFASSIETPEARVAASDAAAEAREDMFATFGQRTLAPGKYLWAKHQGTGPTRVVVSLNDQRAYVYRGDRLVAVSTISSGKPGNDTPTGIFSILQKKPMHHSRKYDNAPMPFMQRIDNYGIALHAGQLPGYPASHGCIRLPSAFAAKLYKLTSLGSTVMIGA